MHQSGSTRRVTADPADIRIGISACLLGEEVRYDGGHKHDRYLTGVLGPYVRFFPLCPEVEIGLGVPRPTIRLEGDATASRFIEPRLVEPRSGADLTAKMNDWARGKMAEIASWDLHGYVLKKGSPSCGLFRVRVHDDKDVLGRHGPLGGDRGGKHGRGLFAARLTEHFPLLPVEEEGRLNDPPLRESFVERLFVHERWKRFLAEDPTSAGLVDFHSRHKLTLMAHSPRHYQRLGQLTAVAGSRPWDELTADYAHGLAAALKVLATRGRHANALQHVMGFVKDDLAAADKAELVETIDDYRRGLLPLIVPITLLEHHLRRHEAPEWIRRQVYLHPYPKELMLRNHV